MDSKQLIIVAAIIAIIFGDYDAGKYNLLILQNAINNIKVNYLQNVYHYC